MSESFKTCMFGGFDKQDVVAYIEKQARLHTDELDALTKQHAAEMESLRRDYNALHQEYEQTAAECAVLRENADRAAATGQELEQLRHQLADMSQRCEALQAENDRCRVPAEEYEKLKDHIAQIEISAHRRTEEFRAQAIEQLRAIAQQQRDWCNQERQRYSDSQQELMQKLAQVRELMASGADGIFDEMLESLQSFEENLA